MKTLNGFCLVLLLIAIISTFPQETSATGTCVQSYTGEVIQFDQGTGTSGLHADPSVLLAAPTATTFVTLGVGGSITLKFTPPIANYAAVGPLVVETPSECAGNPERAEVSVSQNGLDYTLLGTVCGTTSFDLGAFSWVSHVRITDKTDPNNPSFAGAPTDGFDIRTVTGPACLKKLRCPAAAVPDPAFSNAAGTTRITVAGVGSDLVLLPGATFEEYANGTSRLQGTLARQGDPSVSYLAILSFTGRVDPPPSGSPKLELLPGSYVSNGGVIDPGSWYYYKRWQGDLIGQGPLAGQRFAVTSNGAFQIGTGASGFNASSGASGNFVALAPGSSTFVAGALPIEFGVCSEAPASTPLPTLTSTPTPPPTSPPDATPTSTPTSTVTATPTPSFVEPINPEVPVVGPIATPTTVPDVQCTDQSMLSALLAIDGDLLDRRQIIARAVKLLAKNSAFGKKSLTSAAALYSTGWSKVWSHPHAVTTCEASPRCVDISLAAQRAELLESARALDKLVRTVLAKVNTTSRSLGKERILKGLSRKHRALQAELEKELANVPVVTTVCG